MGRPDTVTACLLHYALQLLPSITIAYLLNIYTVGMLYFKRISALLAAMELFCLQNRVLTVRIR
jgi:hypothetical protein